MNPNGEIVIDFAGITLSVAFEGERSAAIVDFLFRDVSAASGGGTAPAIRYRLTPGPESGRLVLERNSSVLWEGPSDGSLAEKLLGGVCRDLAAESRGGLVFHAAAMAGKGGGLFLPGSIAAGKTTLAFWLARSGLRYLTDELVFIPEGAGFMRTFHRPMNLKEASRLALERHYPFDQVDRLGLATSRGILLSARLWRMWEGPTDVPVSRIVFPRFVEGGDFELRPLTPAEAAKAMLECLVNARNLPSHGLPEVVRMAKSVPSYNLRYGRFDQLEAWIAGLRD
jgi:hypothetical protein